ncbi:uncharacterized protein LOC126928504 [Bombus affinis]|uniref:uncharacterized protein LOC126928504 n=1 Tax=Bombus affinis TaxID=309941 RepID=UPI0021B719C6|nr:uncharacterized protein LOC126928504 [Bombus affinis]
MKRYSSAPCLADGNNDSKKAKPMKEPNAREYLQLALARILELQREIKEGTYTTDYTSDLGNIKNNNSLKLVYKPESICNSFRASEIQDRMLRSLDLHLASKQRDYTAKLMRSGI